ncbi:2-C-methyl-D-erythritol 4-phosphate cytidylyltransferase [Synechocystis sp. PCC 7339]|uniref:2-C-methyl-D-erythritol 4-phosphate cytidylyltransferase n=1 Tax=Synechocystis sp. PCC 7339 TaxID=2782213 RepID=UPI001CBECDD3|nr:2-C-methyl-D-erythritol 4-phosphate cytidylyltransferase [Synechocystis sp. PCC 7339]UAJ73697.1 2-C-methyl-D-erythritol 4-phosphate cytidylyltransferase [Synechocystis sp. PCC 7339]
MHLLIPAAGSGKRMGSGQNKLLLNVLGQPLLSWTMKAALASQSIEWIGILGQPYDFPAFEALLAPLHSPKPVQLITGGETRQQSVFNGMQALPQQAKFVLIHDGARCLATPDLFDRCAEALHHSQGLIAAVPVKDTIKIVDSEGWITDTPDRQGLWGAQTPQGFDVTLLKACHEKGKQEGWEVTDDAALLEKCGQPVKIVPGEDTNLKITTPVDLAIAEFILGQRLAKSA